MNKYQNIQRNTIFKSFSEKMKMNRKNSKPFSQFSLNNENY